MSHRIPDLFLYLGGTHVHHLNYGIFLLSLIGAYFLFVRPNGSALRRAAVVYGIGLALTFDEFGMWVHLGGGYWQRASFDAVAVVGALLGLMAAAPTLSRFRARHWSTVALLSGAIALFIVLLADSFRYVERTVGPAMQALEETAPP